MANKKVKKYKIDRESFMTILKNKGLSIRKLDKEPKFEYTSRSIGRALETGFVSYTLAYCLSEFLDVPMESFLEGDEK